MNRIITETVAWWLLQNDNIKSKRFIRAHKNVDTNVFLHFILHIFSWLCRLIHPSNKGKYKMQAQSTSNMLQIWHITFYKWTNTSLWKPFQVLNNVDEQLKGILDSLKCNTAHAKMVGINKTTKQYQQTARPYEWQGSNVWDWLWRGGTTMHRQGLQCAVEEVREV